MISELMNENETLLVCECHYLYMSLLVCFYVSVSVLVRAHVYVCMIIISQDLLRHWLLESVCMYVLLLWLLWLCEYVESKRTYSCIFAKEEEAEDNSDFEKPTIEKKKKKITTEKKAKVIAISEDELLLLCVFCCCCVYDVHSVLEASCVRAFAPGRIVAMWWM